MIRPLVPWCVLFAGCAGLPEPAAAPPRSLRTLDPGCAGSPYASIQDAVDDAADGDEIEICPGTYLETLSIVGKDLAIRASGGPGSVVVDALGRGTTLAVTDAVVEVSALTLRNGVTAGAGGNLSCTSSTLDLSQSRLAGGAADTGGNFAATGCDGLLTGNTFAGGAARDGGGAWVDGDGLSLVANAFVGNEATGSGGGLYLLGASYVGGNRFDENDAGVQGGGLYVSEGAGEVQNNRWVGNTAGDDGGGAYLQGGSVTVTGNLFQRNVAVGDGGGLRIKESTGSVVQDNDLRSNEAGGSGAGAMISHGVVELLDNTFARNAAAGNGGGLAMVVTDGPLRRNRFVRNSATDGGGLHLDGGWELFVAEDTVFDRNTATRDGGAAWFHKPDQQAVFRRMDLTRGRAERGAGLFVVDSRELVFLNGLVAGNEASVAGGGLWLEDVAGSVSNLFVYGNEAPRGAGILASDAPDFGVENTVLGWNRVGAALEVEGAGPAITYDDFWRNDVDFVGTPSVIGVDGNLAVNPRFVDRAGGDYHLQPDSPLVDAGDPTENDTTGDRMDIGLYGGSYPPPD